jgi:hypothetical protein
MSFQALLFNIGASRGDRKRDAAIPLPAGVTECRNISYDQYGESSLLDVYSIGTEADWERISISVNNEALLYANRHTVYEGAEVNVTCTDNGDGTHTVFRSCSLCGGSLGIAAEPCKDKDFDGFCDGCGAEVDRRPDYELQSLKLLDSSERELTAIPDGGFYAEARVKKQKDAEPVVILLVAYTADGQMVSTTFLRADVPTGSTYSQGAWFTNNGNIGEIKAFMLSSLGNPVPLGEAKAVKA